MKKIKRKITIEEVNSRRNELRNLQRRWSISVKCSSNFVYLKSNLEASKKIISDLLIKDFGALIKNSILNINCDVIGATFLVFDVIVSFNDEADEAAFIMCKDRLLKMDIEF
jgi:hypothetical protein